MIRKKSLQENPIMLSEIPVLNCNATARIQDTLRSSFVWIHQNKKIRAQPLKCMRLGPRYSETGSAVI